MFYAYNNAFVENKMLKWKHRTAIVVEKLQFPTQMSGRFYKDRINVFVPDLNLIFLIVWYNSRSIACYLK